MLKSYWLFAPFLLQMACMAADEIGFHLRRGLPRWERLGHPLDTVTVVICLAWVLYADPNFRNAAIFAGLSAFSCLFVTKDEAVHNRHCGATEHWLHAVLFTLHPVVLMSAALLWPATRGIAGANPEWVHIDGSERPAMTLFFVLTTAFAVWQFVFWNLLWRPTPDSR